MKRNRQKTAIALMLLVIATVFTACEDLGNVTVNIPITPTPVEFKLIGDFQKPPVEKVIAQQTEDVILAEAVLKTGLKGRLKEENVDIEQLKALTFDSAEIEIKAPKDYSITRLVGLKVYFEDQLVGEIKDVKDNEKRVEVTINKSDILKYAEKPNLKVTIKGKEKPNVEELVLLLYTKLTAKVSK